MAKKLAETKHSELVVGTGVRALLYAFTRDIPCFYTRSHNLQPVVQPKNQLVIDYFSESQRIGGQSEKEKFLIVDKFGFWLRYLLNLSGKFYETQRENLRFSDGNLIYKTNKTEYVLNADKIYLFDDIKLNGSNQEIKQDSYVVIDQFRTNAKSMETTWFRGHDPFLDYVWFDAKILNSVFTLKDKTLINEFENSTVTIRYLLDEFLTGREEIVLIRDYYRSLKPKLQNRTIIEKQKYYTEESNITVVSETLGELCQKPILPSRESYLYFLTKRNLDLIGTTA